MLNPVYDSNKNMVSATLNDAWVRTEHYLRKSETEFFQLGGSWDQDISDTFRFTALGGFSKSTADIPVETTVVFDDRDAQGYKFDYTDMRQPLLTFGTSVTTPGNFQLAEIRDRPSTVTNKFKTAQLRTEWDVAEGFQVKSGAVWREFDFKTVAFTRDTAVCGNGGVDLVLGTLACSPTSLFGPTAVYGFPVTAALSELFTLGRAGQPGGTTTQWLIPNLPAATAFTRLYARNPALDVGNNRSVTEEVKGGYLQFDAKGDVLGLRYAFNAGVRYAHTDQSSTGINGTTTVTIDRKYDDWLPAVNLALFPTDNFIIRAAVADVMTRPTLGNLTPGGSADGFNYRVTTTVNGTGASLKGAEVALQLPFQFLPGFLKNFGMIANATFVKSSATYNAQGPAITDCVATTPTAACAFGPLVNVTRTSTLFGLSKRAYNGTLYYEDKKFSARVSVSYRGPYVDANSGTGNVFEGYNSSTNVDASVRYKVTPWLELSVEGSNLTDDYRNRYTDLDANRNYEYNHFGRTFLFGARVKL